MKTSRNPKTLHYVIRNSLNSVFDLLQKFKNIESSYRTNNIDNVKLETVEKRSEVEESIEKAKAILGDEGSVYKAIYEKRESLYGLVNTIVYNPNIPDDTENGQDTSNDSPLLTDKSLTDIEFGFVKEGKSILLAGVVNKGLAYGADTNIKGNYTFCNPNNQGFPAFYINDILKLSTTSALIGTNSGIVDYNVLNGKSIMRNTSFGLNSNIVSKILQVRNNTNQKSGYLAGTSKGVSYSVTGSRWVNVDETFKNIVTCFNTTDSLDMSFKKVFIGTTNGLYFFNAASFIAEETHEVIDLTKISELLPSRYINAIAFNPTRDTLYIATDNGLVIINGIMTYIDSGNYLNSKPNYMIYTAKTGLSSTLCFDIVIMPNQNIIIATSNGLTVTKNNFMDFSYITKSIPESSTQGLENYMCSKLIRRSAISLTVLHSVGLTEGIVI
jgi:hypothetical protein